MRKYKVWLGALLLIAGLSFAWVGMASATNVKTGSNVTIGQSEKVDGTLFASGKTVDINTEVNGDIFCAGQNITITATVHGDVICAGQTVSVTGIVDGDVRLAGQTITLNATVGGNATIAGQTFTQLVASTVAHDMTLGASDSTLNGTIGRDLVVGGTNVTLTGSVGRNIKGALEKLNIVGNASVKGDLSYTSKNDASVASTAMVSGTTTRTEPTKRQQSNRMSVFAFSFFWFVYWYCAALFIAMALILLFPRAIHSVSQRGMPAPWKALLTGFLAAFAAPFVIILFAFTVIGIPFALLLGLFWFVITILSGPVYGYYIGRLILRNTKSKLLIMFVGASLLLISYFIPVIGIISLVAAQWIGSGMIVLELFSRTPKPSYAVGDGGKHK